TGVVRRLPLLPPWSSSDDLRTDSGAYDVRLPHVAHPEEEVTGGHPLRHTHAYLLNMRVWDRFLGLESLANTMPAMKHWIMTPVMDCTHMMKMASGHSLAGAPGTVTYRKRHVDSYVQQHRGSCYGNRLQYPKSISRNYKKGERKRTTIISEMNGGFNFFQVTSIKGHQRCIGEHHSEDLRIYRYHNEGLNIQRHHSEELNINSHHSKKD
ncbi:hypothetical protein CEXT_79471, partial [Caerostris extrusa]